MNQSAKQDFQKKEFSKKKKKKKRKIKKEIKKFWVPNEEQKWKTLKAEESG